MLAAVLAEGVTLIRNAAKEPEIEDLQGYLNACGANVQGAGSDTITIEGVKELHDCTEYSIMPDRIEAGTFLIAGAATSGRIHVRNIIPTHIDSLIKILKTIGCRVETTYNSVYLESDLEVLKTGEGLIINTEPYPGFPTDLQAQLTVLLSLTKGRSIINETIFEKRFRHVNELRKMGAKISFNGDKTIEIHGVPELKGANLKSSDLRCGAALVVAGLAAKGNTFVDDDHYIARGYADFGTKINLLGGSLKSVELCPSRTI